MKYIKNYRINEDSKQDKIVEIMMDFMEHYYALFDEYGYGWLSKNELKFRKTAKEYGLNQILLTALLDAQFENDKSRYKLRYPKEYPEEQDMILIYKDYLNFDIKKSKKSERKERYHNIEPVTGSNWTGTKWKDDQDFKRERFEKETIEAMKKFIKYYYNLFKQKKDWMDIGKIDFKEKAKDVQLPIKFIETIVDNQFVKSNISGKNGTRRYRLKDLRRFPTDKDFKKIYDSYKP